MTGRRRGGRVWVMDEKDERFDEEACGEAERRRLAERIKDKAVREGRRAWLVKQGRCQRGGPTGTRDGVG